MYINRKNIVTKVTPYMIELIQAGIKPGELEAVFSRSISSFTINKIIKETRGDVKLEEYLSYRDTNKIKEIIRRGIEEGVITETPRIDCLLDKIDKLAPAVTPYMIELIQAGIKPGEMSAIFPTVSPNTIKDIIKKIRGNAKLEEYLAYRDTDKIKEIIRRGIEARIIVKTPKVERLLDKIDELVPTLSGRKCNISKTLRTKGVKETEAIIAREKLYSECQEWRKKLKSDVSGINPESINTTPERIDTQVGIEK